MKILLLFLPDRNYEKATCKCHCGDVIYNFVVYNREKHVRDDRENHGGDARGNSVGDARNNYVGAAREKHVRDVREYYVEMPERTMLELSE